MLPFPALQAPPFTDKGSSVEGITYLSLWAGSEK